MIVIDIIFSRYSRHRLRAMDKFQEYRRQFYHRSRKIRTVYVSIGIYDVDAGNCPA